MQPVGLASAQQNIKIMQTLLILRDSGEFVQVFQYCSVKASRISCVKEGRECRRCWFTCVHVDKPEHRDAFLCPGERLHSVTAAHTRWLSKEGQVVVPSAAQSSVDAAHTDICLRWLLQGEEKSAFPYACVLCNPSLHPLPPPSTALFCPSLASLNQMAPWTLFTLGDSPRCSVCVHWRPHSTQLGSSFLCLLFARAPLTLSQVVTCAALCLFTHKHHK